MFLDARAPTQGAAPAGSPDARRRQPAELQRLRRHLLTRHSELPLFNTTAWVWHLENLVERLLLEEPKDPDTMDGH